MCFVNKLLFISQTIYMCAPSLESISFNNYNSYNKKKKKLYNT